MINVRVARRYAEALVQLAEERKDFEVYVKDLEYLKDAMKGSRELLLFLKSPIITRIRKRDIFRVLFAGKVQAVTAEFLDILAEKGREDLLPDIIDQFFAIRDERHGIVNVEVKTAVDFSKEQVVALQKKLEGYTNKKVRTAFILDKHLIGGFIARVGDTVFDGSIRRQLELLRERFAGGDGTN